MEMSIDDQGRMITPDSSTIKVFADSLLPISPWPLERIGATITATDTMALIATQALYGSSFGPAQADQMDFVSRSREQTMRFGFSLLMADRSALAADLMGLRFVDREVEPGKRYIYYLNPLGTYADLRTLSIVKNDPSQNTKVEEVAAREKDGTVQLFWPKKDNKFSGYWIERSANNGKTWEKLTEELLVFVEDKRYQQAQIPEGVIGTMNIDPNAFVNNNFIFVDSTANYVEYTYRISGQTPFADFSDYTYVSASSKDLTPPPPPLIVSHKVDDETGIATLVWEMNYKEELLEDLAGFSIWDAPHADSTFVKVSALLPPSTRSYTSPQPLEKNRSHYYLLKAVDDKGNEISSFPLYMHLIDNIPPRAPQNPASKIDSTGVVTLVWRPNTEADLVGYRVLFTNNPKNELTPLTATPISVNIFRDTIEILTLTEKIYYRIQAVDRSYNRSAYSDWIEVQKPDFIPPVSPILHRPEMNDTLIQLSWKPSTSTDVEAHLLYRRKYASGEEWEILERFSATDSSYTDRTTEVEQFYEYTLRAQDDAGLLSEMAFPVKGRRWFGEAIPGIENLQLRYDSTAQSVELSWQYQPTQQAFLQNEEYRFYIYRSVGDTSLIRYRIVEANELTFTDSRLPTTDRYNYAIKLVYLNGKSSNLCAPVSVQVSRE